jgi:hypothetical protein
MSSDKFLREVWAAKDKANARLAKMSRRQQRAYFAGVTKKLRDKFGLDLPTVSPTPRRIVRRTAGK